MNEMRKLIEAINYIDEMEVDEAAGGIKVPMIVVDQDEGEVYVSDEYGTIPAAKVGALLDELIQAFYGGGSYEGPDYDQANGAMEQFGLVANLEESTVLHEYREDDMDEIASELEDIKNNIANLMHEAASLVDNTNERDAARAYWIGHILGALDNESEYMGGSMTTMQDSIDAIREEQADEEDDYAEEDHGDEDFIGGRR